MDTTTGPSKDEGLTQSAVNYLSAAYQGKFAYLNILAQLGLPGATEAELNSTKEILSEIRSWADELTQGQPVLRFAWTKAESPKAKRLMELLSALKKDCEGFAAEILSWLEAPNVAESQPLLGKLVAAYGRYAYTRDNYIRGNLDFATRFNLEKIKTESNHNLKETAEEVGLTHSLVKELKRTLTPSTGFLTILAVESRPLPGCFKVFAHESNVLLNAYEPEFTFEMTKIGLIDVAKWRELGIPAAEAGNWAAHGIPPEEAGRWIQLSIPMIHSSTAAARWRFAAFGPEECRPWAELGIPPTIAQIWRDSGFDSKTTADFLRKGVKFPPEKKKEDEPTEDPTN